jgi:serine/threonine protein phosphatase PrpC
MVVYEWFARIGQVLAPDKNYNADESAQEKDSIWHILAPDPNFIHPGGEGGNDSATLKSHTRSADSSMRSPGTAQGSSDPNSAPLYTPSPYRSKGFNPSTPLSLQTPRCTTPYSNSDVERRVVSAAKDRAAAMTSPIAVLKSAGSVFRICKNSTALSPKLQETLRKAITKDPSVLHIRSNGPQYECPEGYTIFMVAADANQIQALEIIWDCSRAIGGSPATMRLLTETNLEGKTVHHIAAGRGHTEAVAFLQEKHREVYGPDSHNAEVPVDLMGQTPLGAALLSPDVKAKRNKAALMEQLYSENDQSLLGSPLPVDLRIVGSTTSLVTTRGVKAIAGMSEIPGKRVRMEDCTICKATSDGTLLLTVCDGHGDEGLVSHFVAESLITGIDELLPKVLDGSSGKEIPSWESVCTDLCLRTDDALRSTNLRGGSVGVLAVVTDSSIVVCNIGDCRCILVQTRSTKEDLGIDEVADTMKSLSLNAADKAATGGIKTYSVKALSVDHKPNLPGEKERIEKSGLSVIEEVIGDDFVLHKILLSDGNRLATSRAFGDFEYKANQNVDVESQALVAVPEVSLYDRSPNDVALVLGCDGIWDVMSNEDVAMFVTDRLNVHCSHTKKNDATAAVMLPQIGDELLMECLKRGSDDNMSVVIVALSTMAELVIGIQPSSDPVVPPKVLDYAPASGMTTTE